MTLTDLKKIEEVASSLGLHENEYEKYGNYMAKVSLSVLERVKNNKTGKLVLVTAISPTKEGEGKTTTAIGLAQGFQKLGKKACIAIREPSLGPCFGIKGGAAGGGLSKVEPSDRINLLFTSDFPAVSAAHNLLSAMINNHMYFNKEPRLDPRRIVFPRTVDMNDRSLRDIVIGAGGPETGVLMKDNFVITAASEIMAILGLATGYSDLKERLSRILVGYDVNGKPVHAYDLNAQGAMAALLRDALLPNLVQSTEGVPAFVHVGPFGNIAHGTSSIIADRMALGLTDYLITEAGFGSELGAEKFFDMVSRIGNLPIDAVVIVATIRALKFNSGMQEGKDDPVEMLSKGSENLLKHVDIIRRFGVEPVVAINKFPNDTKEEIAKLESILKANKVEWSLSEGFAKGGNGTTDLARKVMEKIEAGKKEIKRAYSESESVKEKIMKIATTVYGAKDVIFEKQALKDLRNLQNVGMNNSYVCMAKTQYSVTDDPLKLGWPKDFTVTVKKISVSSGAGFVVPLLGEIMTMPGLPKIPAAEKIELTDDGEITGLS